MRRVWSLGHRQSILRIALLTSCQWHPKNVSQFESTQFVASRPRAGCPAPAPIACEFRLAGRGPGQCRGLAGSLDPIARIIYLIDQLLTASARAMAASGPGPGDTKYGEDVGEV